MTQIPPTLVFTREIPQGANAGSQQLLRVFQGHPPEKLVVLGPAPVTGAETLPCRYVAYNSRWARLTTTRFARWFNTANVMGLVPQFEPRKLDRLIWPFRPEVVFTVMDCFHYYWLAALYARRLGVPLVAVTMDHPGTFEGVHAWAKGIQMRAIRRVYDYVSVSLGVSREMAEWLEAEFGRKSKVLYFGPPDELKPRPMKWNTELRRKGKLRVGYGGSLYFYERELKRLLPAFVEAGAELWIYGMHSSWLANHSAVVDRGNHTAMKAWDLVQKECDAVILPYPGGGHLEHIFRTHFPTKLSEYCWLGMPVIITGPNYATGVRWGLRNRDACVTLVSPSVEGFQRVLERMKEQHEWRQLLAQKAVEIAQRDFDPSRIRSDFTAHLHAAARSVLPHSGTQPVTIDAFLPVCDVGTKAP